MIIINTWWRIFVILIVIVSCQMGCAQGLELEDFYIFLSGTDRFDSVDDIEYVEGNFTPDCAWNQMGKIRCWVDIVGYTGMVRVGDQYYIGKPAWECVRVQHGKEHLVNTGGGSGWSVTSFESNIYSKTLTREGMVVTIKVNLKYKYVWYTVEGDPPKLKRHVNRYSQVAYFNDLESFVPMEYPNPGEYVATVVVYNNTIKPKAICEFNVGGLDTGVTYTYFNETLKFRKYDFLLEHTEGTNCPYGNMTFINQWENMTSNNSLIFPFMNSVWIPGANFSEDNLSVYVNTPYNQGTVPINVTQIDGFNNEIHIFDILYILVYVVAILLLVLLMCVGITKMF